MIGSSLGEGNGKKAEEIVISRFDGDVRFDESLPFANKRSEFVGGEVQTMEVGEAVFALNLIDPKLDFAERMVLILL